MAKNQGKLKGKNADKKKSLILKNQPPPHRNSNKVPRRTNNEKAGKFEPEGRLELQEEEKWNNIKQEKASNQIDVSFCEGKKKLEKN